MSCDVRLRGSRRLMHRGARIPALRGTALRASAVHNTIWDDDVLFLLDFDETHLAMSARYVPLLCVLVVDYSRCDRVVIRGTIDAGFARFAMREPGTRDKDREILTQQRGAVMLFSAIK